MKDLKDHTILITGAANGNGFGISEVCCEYFRNLILVDIDKDGLRKAKNKLSMKNPDKKIDTFCCDLSQMKDIDLLIKNLYENYSKIETIVNNAGISLSLNQEDSLSSKLEKWNRTLQINLTAPYYLIEGLKDLIPNDTGSIINITSLNSSLAFPDNPSYMASKGGMRQLTLSFATDLGNRNIRVNAIAPGYFKTNMTKASWDDLSKREQRSSRTILNRWGESQELGGIVCFLASNLSSYITGQEICVDGGWSIKGL